MPETNYAPDPRNSPPTLPPDGRTPSRFTYRVVSVTGVAQRILGVNHLRNHAVIGHSGAVSVFLARQSGVSTGSPFELARNLPTEVPGYEELWAITAGTAVTVSILEFFK